MQIRRAQPAESRALAQWIAERHYLRSTPPGFVVALEFLEGRQRIGAILIGRPASRSYDARYILELTRMFFVDSAPTNTESRALALMRKYIRTWLPTIRLLIAYSDPGAGHSGGVYQADGWASIGRTRKSRGYGWESRPNRAGGSVGPKIRWVRTP